MPVNGAVSALPESPVIRFGAFEHDRVETAQTNFMFSRIAAKGHNVVFCHSLLSILCCWLVFCQTIDLLEFFVPFNDAVRSLYEWIDFKDEIIHDLIVIVWSIKNIETKDM